MAEIECRISKIIINERQDGQIIWIEEAEGKRSFAVIVGFYEASSLRDRIKSFQASRPLTHNLISNCIRGMGGRLTRIVVTEIKDSTYFANLVVEANGDTVLIDARPSDALVMAAQEGVPIYVADEVLSQAGKWAIDPKMDFSIQDLEQAFGEKYEEFDAFEDDDEEDDDDQDDDEEETGDF